MLTHLFRLGFLCIAIVTAPLCDAQDSDWLTYNHVFNAINSAMRRQGSSYNSNGMSFFLAEIPGGALMYHGNPKSDRVKGVEFLAFDPEFSLIFARKRRGGGHGGHTSQQFTQRKASPRHLAVPQDILKYDFSRESEEDGDNLAGWLHTYRTNKDLNVIYVDGRSAAKSDRGTLDSFDRILMNDTTSGFFEDEYKRAETLCRLSRERWEGHIDGVIRLGGDFELILCDFEKDLELVRMVRTKAAPSHGNASAPQRGRVEGIGASNVHVNFDTFVSAFTYGLDLYNYTNEEHTAVHERSLYNGFDLRARPGELRDGQMPQREESLRQPRLKHIPTSALEPIRHDVDELLLNHFATNRQHNWQTITDMMISRYARELADLASDFSSPPQSIRDRIERFLAPFIDYGNRDMESEISSCATQYLPPAGAGSLAFRAVNGVSRQVCETLFRSLYKENDKDVLDEIRRLVDILDWTVWNADRS